jgi:hypothetical protein
MQEKKSIFVDVLGWIMIILSAGALIISIGQNIIINFVFNDNTFAPGMSNGTDGLASSIFQNMRIILAVFALIILYALIISIAFLKRKEWGRVGLILLFGLIIMYNVASLIMQWTIINNVETESPPFNSDFEKMATAIKAFTAILVIGLSVLLGWLIKKISSKKIAAEFKVIKIDDEQLPMDDLDVTTNENSNRNDDGPQLFLNEGVG